ncbi:related to TSR2 - Twenty S rRNA accumulation protein [Cephalotrichum gorgonifer]|uniref:Related to TSR2 - Twenty S rRNA accumulation protein n=1 Tax=Cephalotrichum gorgonifer TaxID=2041049 RepID=A0AAE8N1U0_9PEZI|nr:related to TSR2 - Twenty S rRNA accumulation protein [Cephalotrichum gorgonifer]
MATTDSSSSPSVETMQTNFEQGIAYALHLWPDLTLAVSNQLGGPDSSDKRDWLAGAVVDLFPPFAKPSSSTTPNSTTANANASEDIDNFYIQEFLQGAMEDNFELMLEDGDPALWRVAEQIVRVRRECAEGKFGNVDVLRAKWLESKGKGVEALYRKGEDQDQDTDWDSEEGDDESGDEGAGADTDMGEAPPLVQAMERAPPEVDEDGFTKVASRRRK